jgi:hypothetical protein
MPADLIDMFKLLLLYALSVANPGEMACVGSIQDSMLPLDIYVAGVKMEGIATLGAQGQILHLNGPKVSTLKPGVLQRIVRPEGRVRDPLSGDKLGFYYIDVGTIRIDVVEQDKAKATVQMACHGVLKGDLVIPFAPKPKVEFDGSMSTELTPLPDHGLVSSILLGKEDVREMGNGHFCFLGLGSRDGVKPGDRFTVFRAQPKFDPKDMATSGTSHARSYSSIVNYAYRFDLNLLLQKRKIAPQILGDIVVVEAGESISTGKIVNSNAEMHIGDLIVKR